MLRRLEAHPAFKNYSQQELSSENLLSGEQVTERRSKARSEAAQISEMFVRAGRNPLREVQMATDAAMGAVTGNEQMKRQALEEYQRILAEFANEGALGKD